MGVEIEGFDEVQRVFSDLERKARKVQGPNNVPIKELLTPKFLSACSRFRSVDELFAASGLVVDSTDDSKAIPSDQWDAFVQSNTTFANWKVMLKAAAVQWTKKQLGF
jgi:hypothetical protein